MFTLETVIAMLGMAAGDPSTMLAWWSVIDEMRKGLQCPLGVQAAYRSMVFRVWDAKRTIRRAERRMNARESRLVADRTLLARLPRQYATSATRAQVTTLRLRIDKLAAVQASDAAIVERAQNRIDKARAQYQSRLALVDEVILWTLGAADRPAALSTRQAQRAAAAARYAAYEQAHELRPPTAAHADRHAGSVGATADATALATSDWMTLYVSPGYIQAKASAEATAGLERGIGRVIAYLTDGATQEEVRTLLMAEYDAQPAGCAAGKANRRVYGRQVDALLAKAAGAIRRKEAGAWDNDGIDAMQEHGRLARKASSTDGRQDLLDEDAYYLVHALWDSTH